MRRLSFIALLFLSAYGYAQFPMVGSGRQVYRPDQVDSLFYWFDAQDLTTITTTNNKVTAWADKGPFGYDVVQADTSKAPTYSATSGPGGSTAAMVFDGTDDFLASAAHWWGSDDLTIFVVMKFGNATRDASEMVVTKNEATGDQRQWQFFARDAASFYVLDFLISNNGTGTSVNQNQFSAKSTSFRVIAYTHDGDLTPIAHINGLSQIVMTGGSGDGTIYNSVTPKFAIGATNVINTPSAFFQGSISEIIVFSRALTNVERQGIEAYLSSKYNLPLENKQKQPVISNRRIQPDYVDSLFYWFDANDASTITTNNNKVTQWDDKGPFGYDVVQADTSKAPTYSATAGPGGSTAALSFDGSDDFLASSSHWWGSDDITVFVVMKFGDTSTTASNYILAKRKSGAFSWGVACFGTTNSNREAMFIVKDSTASNYLQVRTPNNFKHTTWKVKAWRNDGLGVTLGINQELFTDGAGTSLENVGSVGSPDGTIANCYSQLDVGVVLSDSSPQLYLQGSISEIIVFSRALSDSERRGIENYLNEKYSLW